MIWLFWLARAFNFGSYRYALLGWWTSALWHGLLFSFLFLSILGIIAALAVDFISTLLSLLILLVSWKVLIEFMPRDKYGPNKALQPTPSRFALRGCADPLPAVYHQLPHFARSGWLSLTLGY